MAEQRNCPKLAADAICIKTNKQTNKKQILLITRKKNPSIGCFALPGGHVEYGEDPQECVVRELEEETSIQGKNARLFTVRGKPNRDPRYHVVTIVYWVDISDDAEPKAGDDAATATFYDIDEVKSFGPERFAFDHHDLIQEILKQI
ncbi:hypothetical protein ABPG74_005566 [Tetrahymena malaccensis]